LPDKITKKNLNGPDFLIGFPSILKFTPKIRLKVHNSGGNLRCKLRPFEAYDRVGDSF